MKKPYIVKIDKSLKELLSYECFSEVDFREYFRTITSQCIDFDISVDFDFTYTAFGKKFVDLKSAAAYVTEHMLSAMQFVYAWAHMSDDEFRGFRQSFDDIRICDSDETAQKN